jgi:hypothetical protein
MNSEPLNVGVDPGDVERKPQPEFLESGGNDPFALGPHGDGLDPAGGDVGGVEGEEELTVVVPALVSDQVDLEADRMVCCRMNLSSDSILGYIGGQRVPSLGGGDDRSAGPMGTSRRTP